MSVWRWFWGPHEVFLESLPSDIRLREQRIADGHRIMRRDDVSVTGLRARMLSGEAPARRMVQDIPALARRVETT